MFYPYVILAFIAVFFLVRHINYLTKKKGNEPTELPKEKIKTFHIFPDYPKNMPYECKPGEEFHFIVRGYTDKYQLKGVFIDGDKVVWKYTKGNGQLKGDRDIKTGKYSGTSINYITPEIKDPYAKEKLIFISAHYLGLTDATWIKIIR